MRRAEQTYPMSFKKSENQREAPLFVNG